MSQETLSNLGVGGVFGPRLQKVLAELQGLKHNIVAGATAGTEIAIAGIEFEDTLVSVQNLTDLEDLDVADFTIGDRRASGTLTIAEALEDGDAVAVNGKTYTFVEQEEVITYNMPPQTIPITIGASGVDVAVVAAKLAKVLMSSDNNLYCESAAGVVTIIWRTAGTVGNAKTLVVTASGGHVTRSAATLLGGADTNGIVGADSTASKKLGVVWFDKNP